MQQFCQYGSVRGATGNRRPYRDNSYPYTTPSPRSRLSVLPEPILAEVWIRANLRSRSKHSGTFVRYTRPNLSHSEKS